MLRRAPRTELSAFASDLWAGAGGAPLADRERVVPTGNMHLVVRLSVPELRTFRDASDERGEIIKGPIVGGPRGGAYHRDISRPSDSVGVMLRPGAARALFGVTARELSEQHLSLSDLWGSRADVLLDELSALHTPELRLARFEALLMDELIQREARAPDRRVLFAAERLGQGARVDELAEALALSPRRFYALFHEEVGLSPKRFARVKRVQAALALASRSTARPCRSWATIAAEIGFADQAHLSRELRAIADVTPSAFRALAPTEPNHLPIHESSARRERRFVQDSRSKR